MKANKSLVCGMCFNVPLWPDGHCRNGHPQRSLTQTGYASWSTGKTLEWSLDLVKVVGSCCNLLLVFSDHESYPALLDHTFSRRCTNMIYPSCMWWPIRMKSCGMWRVLPVGSVLHNWREALRNPFTKKFPRELTWSSLSHLTSRGVGSVQNE